MPKLLRITTVPHSLDLLLRGQIKYMSEHGFDVSIASSNGPEIKDIEARENVKHYPISFTRSLNPLKDIVALVQTIKLLMKLQPDIVHTHSPKAGIIGMLAAKICNVPLKIHTVAGLPLVETTGLKRQLLIGVEKLTYFFADWILPNSENLMKYIKQCIYSSQNVVVLGKGSSNGIDLHYYKSTSSIREKANSLRSQYDINDEDIVLTFVGRLANYKGINELVESFKILQSKYNNIKLFLVGPYEEINPLKPEKIYDIEHNSAIIATGHQDDIRPYLSLTDIFVFPSYREGFPQALMQACAYGIPCVASNINGCNEIVFDGFNGRLVSPKNVVELTAACDDLICNKHIREEFGNNARGFLEEYYEQGQFWEHLHKFYLEKLER